MPRLPVLQVNEVSLAVGTLNDIDVELYISSQLRVKSVKKIAPKLLPARTRQPGTVPDGSQRVKLKILSVISDIFQTGTEVGRITKGLFHTCQLLRG
jgi:hypothetical protein